MSLALIVLLLGAACTSRVPSTERPADLTVIVETTQGRLGDTLVGVGNIRSGTYTLADGTIRTGPTAQLFFDGQVVVVGPESVIQVADQAWRVVEVTEAARREVAFERVDARP